MKERELAEVVLLPQRRWPVAKVDDWRQTSAAMTDESFTLLQAENTRLVALLEAHGIEWRLPVPHLSTERERDCVPRSTEEKLALFRRLFQGRTDVFPVRWESASTGKSGYSPACANDRRPGVCQKPEVKCGLCRQDGRVPLCRRIDGRHPRSQAGPAAAGG